jgi:hypothetical protein
VVSGQLAELRTPDYIVLKILWSGYTSTGDTRYVPAEWRNKMMGLGIKGIADDVAEKLNNSTEKILIPYQFALIKESVSGANPHTALGAVAIYHYAGSSDKVRATCQAMSDVCGEIKREKLKSRPLNEFEVITGVKVE